MKRIALRYEPHHGVPLAVNELSIGMMLWAPMPEREPYSMIGATAVVEVGYGGALSQRSGCAWDSYPEVADRLRKAFAEPLATSVAIRVDSPGGDALGCFELFQEIRDMALASGKPLRSFVDGTAASAAFAIACAATHGVYIPPAGMAGSVGVMVPSVDMTAADAAAGLKYTLFSSGARKLDGNPHIRMTDDAAAEIKARVQALADIFFDVVAKGRAGSGATQMSIRALEGRMFIGDAAVKAGLADAVKTWAEVIALAQGGSSAGEKTMKLDSEKRAAAIAGIRAAYGDDKEGGEKAIKAAFPDEGEDKEKKEKEEKEKAAAKAKTEEEEKAKAQAQAELQAKAEAGDIAAIKALAFESARSVQALSAKLAARDEADARAALLAKRPDFDESVRKILAVVSLDELRTAVETFPRIGTVKLTSVPMPVGTPGKNQVPRPSAEVTDLDEETVEGIHAAMGLTDHTPAKASTYVDGVHELEYVTPEVARARLEELKKEGARK